VEGHSVSEAASVSILRWECRHQLGALQAVGVYRLTIDFLTVATNAFPPDDGNTSSSRNAAPCLHCQTEQSLLQDVSECRERWSALSWPSDFTG
jgi:hypothetical protein